MYSLNQVLIYAASSTYPRFDTSSTAYDFRFGDTITSPERKPGAESA